PMPAIELPESDDVTARERAVWERDLLGVELTESPLSREMYARADDFVVFSSQIASAATDGKVSALGQIAAVRELTTRKGEQFLAVTLTLLDGELEIVVWPDLLATTRSLWTEGRFVAVTGRLRERNGRTSLAASEAREYRLTRDDDGREEEPLITGAAPPAREDTGAIDHGPVTEAAPDLVDDADATGAPDAASVPAPQQKAPPRTDGDGESAGDGFILLMRETGEPLEDRYRLEDLVKLLLEYRGPDAVILEVETQGRIVRLDMPFVTVATSPELEGKLVDLLGPDCVRTPAGPSAGQGGRIAGPGDTHA
ncbi:MAG: hypothetical protein FJ313_02465, partial [Gemmatimonadetes bacterium]|nr:hypothetical protein [Gemmatimonadota bacterium]